MNVMFCCHDKSIMHRNGMEWMEESKKREKKREEKNIHNLNQQQQKTIKVSFNALRWSSKQHGTIRMIESNAWTQLHMERQFLICAIVDCVWCHLLILWKEPANQAKQTKRLEWINRYYMVKLVGCLNNNNWKVCVLIKTKKYKVQNKWRLTGARLSHDIIWINEYLIAYHVSALHNHKATICSWFVYSSKRMKAFNVSCH